MFHNYQTIEFGNRIRELRKGLNLTQQDVSDMTGINLDTLRKVENGYVVPRYDTLEILSLAYKQDLLEVFKNYRFTSDLYEIYNMLDRYIMDYQPEKLKTIKDKIYNLDSRVYNMMVVASEITKLKSLIDAIYIIQRNNGNPNDEEMERAREILVDILRMENPHFELEDVTHYKYTYFEVRVLTILSMVLRKQKDCELNSKILFFILKVANKSEHASFMEKLLVIKIYSSIAYNYYIMDMPLETLEYADEGIKFAQSNFLMYAFPLLYMRKGIAEMKLNRRNYMRSVKKSINLLDIQGNRKLKSVYIKVLKDKYNIEL